MRRTSYLGTCCWSITKGLMVKLNVLSLVSVHLFHHFTLLEISIGFLNSTVFGEERIVYATTHGIKIC